MALLVRQVTPKDITIYKEKKEMHFSYRYSFEKYLMFSITS